MTRIQIFDSAITGWTVVRRGNEFVVKNTEGKDVESFKSPQKAYRRADQGSIGKKAKPTSDSLRENRRPRSLR
jgi:hypothetical protein